MQTSRQMWDIVLQKTIPVRVKVFSKAEAEKGSHVYVHTAQRSTILGLRVDEEQCRRSEEMLKLEHRALHEKETRSKGGITRIQFFLIALVFSFAYYIFPGYLFQILSSLSWLCWLAPKSILVQQLGSGMCGLGIGALGFNWTTISSYLGSPLANPWFASANVAVGFVLVMYVMTPLTYWYNVYNAKTFPIFSSSLFTQNGTKYNTVGVIDVYFQLDKAAYNQYGKLHLSTFFAMTYGLGFAGLSATLVHIFLFHGRFPKQKWIRLIHMPVLLGATAMMPPASSVNYTSWLILAFLSGYVVYRRWPHLWERYNYVLCGGLDAGTAFIAVLLFISLQSKDISVDWWGNNVDGSCPTAKGVIAKGCPAIL
ncbi:hypothetical protein RND71_018128 [Anisodus tanguticus]|uniref:Uncharacterized protein n=1 Tax=Anisodus tanguticus TaxID=243964 RepID=A0AAE1VBS5_9SOLA|nr:hypothetical protein RND71_018128 [Anisodus tanguticus]